MSLRLVDHLKGTGLSNRQARAAMTTGKVWWKQVPCADPGRMVEPAEVEIRPNAPRITMGRDVVVLFADEHLAVVVKPSGMLSVPAPRRAETNVLAEVGRRRGQVLAVHRLDEGTSGAMMVAFTERAQQGLKAQLEVHSVERAYLALVKGRLAKDRAVTSNLVRNRGDGLRGTGTGEGRSATTHLQTLEVLKGTSLLEARLETGRTHQVRIHCLEQGCPILGDPLYAKSFARLAPRLALHATLLAFEHPITGVAMRFEVPLADDLEQLRRTLVVPPR